MDCSVGVGLPIGSGAGWTNKDTRAGGPGEGGVVPCGIHSRSVSDGVSLVTDVIEGPPPELPIPSSPSLVSEVPASPVTPGTVRASSVEAMITPGAYNGGPEGAVSEGDPPWWSPVVVGGVELIGGQNKVCSVGATRNLHVGAGSGSGWTNKDTRAGGPGEGGAVPCGIHSRSVSDGAPLVINVTEGL